MADRCKGCRRKIPDNASAHQWHDPRECNAATRALCEPCRCDGWVCLACCPDEDCTPLQSALQAGRAEIAERAEVWDRNVAAAEKARA